MKRLFFLLLVAACNKPPLPAVHVCPFPLCPFQGMIGYDATRCGCKAGSDCYYLDLLHLKHPAASYDELVEIQEQLQKN